MSDSRPIARALRPTIRDVAAAAGVSMATVSNVLANKPYVRPTTAELVRRAVTDLGYRASTTARSLRLGRSWSIGLVIDDISNPFAPEVVRGVEEVVWAHKNNLILCNTDSQSEKKMAYVRSLVDKHVDGLILMSQTFSAQEAQSLRLADVPLVTINRPNQFPRSDHVGINNATGVRMAMDYLAGLGHRRIGFIRGPDSSLSANERLLGYIEAVRRHGLAEEPALVVQGDYTMESGSIALQRLFARRTRPTAVLAANDLMAIGALGALRELALGVPGDVSVVGFDDIPFSSHPLVSLTSVQHGKRETGAIAARLLLRRIADGALEPPRTVILNTALVVRGTTAPPRPASRGARDRPASRTTARSNGKACRSPASAQVAASFGTPPGAIPVRDKSRSRRQTRR